MAKQRDIWKFNDDEWKVHISDNKMYEDAIHDNKPAHCKALLSLR